MSIQLPGVPAVARHHLPVGCAVVTKRPIVRPPSGRAPIGCVLALIPARSRRTSMPAPAQGGSSVVQGSFFGGRPRAAVAPHVAAAGQGRAVVHDQALEAEAERRARGVAQLQPAPAGVRPVRAGVVQRLSYRSTTTNSTFRITEGVNKKGQLIEVEDRNRNSASLTYNYP